MKTKHKRQRSSPSAEAEATVTPTRQPAKLSEKDEAKLLEFLDTHEKPFSVATVSATKKRKRGATHLHVQRDLFDERLSVAYEVKPATNWESLRQYKKFTVLESESTSVGDCVLVEHGDTSDPNIDPAEQWKAKVLEVRALDTSHVYLRVAWLNRPEDLDAGRKAYHGKNELIPSNQMDIIDAMTVNGRLDVQHWDDADEESTIVDEDAYFWRQTYDFANTKTFSKLHHICVDDAPQNPDEMVLQCSSADCRKWLHVKCIAEDAVRRAAEAASGEQPGLTKSPTGKKKAKEKRKSKAKGDIDSSAQAVAQKDAFTAEVLLEGLSQGTDSEPAERTEIVFTDGQGEQRSESVRCLFCSSEIE